MDGGILVAVDVDAGPGPRFFFEISGWVDYQSPATVFIGFASVCVDGGFLECEEEEVSKDLIVKQ